MYRFTLLEEGTREERILDLKRQMQLYLESDSMKRLLLILGCDDKNPDGEQILSFLERFNTRKRGQERQLMEDADFDFEAHRTELYGIFDDLGLINISSPVLKKVDHICVLGGSYGANHARTVRAKEIADAYHVKSIDALGGNRRIGDNEWNESTVYGNTPSTEFESLADAFRNLFQLDAYQEESNHEEDNRMASIRIFNSEEDRKFRVYCAPSSEPDVRRANSADTYQFYFKNNDFSDGETFLLVTNNQYCNYQFIPFAMEAIDRGIKGIDIVGNRYGDALSKVNEYSPSVYLQEIIAAVRTILLFYNKY